MIFYTRWVVDWRSPLGYIVPWYIQAAGLYCICHVSANNFVYDTGLCATILNYISDIKQMISSLNEAGKANGSKMDVHKNISRFLRCHVKAKELSEFKYITNTNHIIRRISFILKKYTFRFIYQFADTYEFYIIVCFLWCLATISVTLLVVKMEIVESFHSDKFDFIGNLLIFSDFKF